MAMDYWVNELTITELKPKQVYIEANSFQKEMGYAIESEYLIGRFPSQNPIVQKREEPFEIEDGIEIQAIISRSYFDWWEYNKHKEFNEFKEIDPLSYTEYRWD